MTLALFKLLDTPLLGAASLTSYNAKRTPHYDITKKEQRASAPHATATQWYRFLM